jgi:hypothetical protein
VSDLLCRVGEDSPHFIIYPAIVGASRKAEKKTESVSGKGMSHFFLCLWRRKGKELVLHL